MTTELDPSLQQRIAKLAEAYPDRWEEVIGGRTESRSWILGMAAFGLDEAFDRKAAQAWIDGQVETIRHLDKEAAKEPEMLGTYSRMPIVSRVRGVPEAAPVEDVLAKAVVEGAEAEVSELSFITAGADVAHGNHDDPNAPPRMEISISDIQPDGSVRAMTWHAVEVVSHDQQQDPDFATVDIKVPTKEEAQSYFASFPRCPPPPREIVCGLDGSIKIVARHGVPLKRPEIPTGDEAAEIAEQINDVFGGYFTTSDLSEDEVSEMIDAIDLTPGTFIELSPAFQPIDYDQLGGWLYEIISSAGVCTYDEARPGRPFHLDQAIAPLTDGGTRTEAEHIIAKAIDGGLGRFKDGMKLPEVDVQNYKTALAFEPD